MLDRVRRERESLPPSPEDSGLRHGIRLSLIVYGVSRLVVLVLAKAVGSFWPDSGNVGEVLSRWDGGWYAMIAVRGYANSVPPGGIQSAAASSCSVTRTHGYRSAPFT